VIFNYYIADKTVLKLTASGIWGERSSVQFINTPNVMDTVNAAIGSYNPRQVDRDFYNGFSFEGRVLHHFELGQIKSTLAGGVRYSDQETRRRQKGKGTTGSDYDMTIVGQYGIDLVFHTTNYAAFVETMFRVSDRFSVTPGIRYEVIQSDLTGVINKATFPVSYKGNRAFPLLGIGTQYTLSNNSQLYGNISQAYRPFLYANITPADQLGVIDPNLKDSKGYDIDAGYRGQISDLLKFDVNGFYLFYGDKIGNVTQTTGTGSPYLFTTNLGNSVAQGVEVYLNLSLLKAVYGKVKSTDLRLFSSLAYTHARYVSGSVSNGTDNISLVGNRVEGVPDWINRFGLELTHKGISTTVQASYTSQKYNDANNTVFSTTGVVGVVPSYMIYDWAIRYRFLNQYHVSAGINNLANTMYFSRRINMYPGPGILPADGRTFYLSLGLKI
jgi:Fe(3+) dicitrate transport protein